MCDIPGNKCISLLTGKGILGFDHAVNFFQAANSFMLPAIALFIVTKKCECKNDELVSLAL
ncbi:MAG TPA: hypothetical protein DDY34_11300 [Bacteroidales bacterium]|nr:hypothetical protein [Bacteroidales bacterium]